MSKQKSDLKERIRNATISTVRFVYPSYRPKPKELLDLIEWKKHNEVADNVYSPPEYYQPQAFYTDNNEIHKRTNAKGDTPKLDIEDINTSNDLDIDLEEVLDAVSDKADMLDLDNEDENAPSAFAGEITKLLPLGKVLFNLTPNKLQILAHLPQGGGDVNNNRNGYKRRKGNLAIIPTIDENGKSYRNSTEEVVDGKTQKKTTNRLDRTHLIPIGYHGTESSSMLLVYWDGKSNKGKFNKFETEQKAIDDELIWLTSIERVKTADDNGEVGYYLKWHSRVMAVNLDYSADLFDRMGNDRKPIQGVWKLNNGLNVWTPQSAKEQEALDEFEKQKEDDDENSIEFNYDFNPELEKNYKLRTKAKKPLEIQIGINTQTGEPIMMDLAKCPHLLVAGTTGSGKSVGVNSWIEQIMANNTPYDVVFFGIDPKRVELQAYIDSPYFPVNPIQGEEKAVPFLCWFTEVTEYRYKILQRAGALNLENYHELIENDPEWARENGFFHMPLMVLFIDEFSNLMTRAGAKVENYVGQLAEKARAAGVHMIIATQHPTVDVISSKIKGNIATRICFKVASWSASNVVLDDSGGEKLLGRGDMLIKDSDLSASLVRAQSLFINDKEKASQLEYYKRVYPRAKEINWEQELIKWGKAEYNEEGQLELI